MRGEIMNIVDLSVTLNNKTVTYPTDPKVSLERVAHIDDCGYNVSSLSMGTHSGTHVDLPLHCMRNGLDAASAPLEFFCGDAVMVEVPYESGKPVEMNAIDVTGIKEGDILIIRTGWEEHSGKASFFQDYPGLSIHTARLLKELRVKAVGTDLPSVDGPGSKGEIHNAILSNNIMIVEALVNLKMLSGRRFFFSAAPLKIEQGDGSAVRAFGIFEVKDSTFNEKER
jgi:arylformamidase